VNTAGQSSPRPFLVPPPHPAASALSPLESLSNAWGDMLHLLFQPFEGRRWMRLSAICLFLGGGTSTAAFQWGFSTLPVNLHPAHMLFRARLFLAQHLSLMVLAGVLSVGLGVGLLYVRCVLRFVLVDAILARSVSLRCAWKKLEPSGRGYFYWIGGILSALILVGLGLVAALVPYLRFGRDASRSPWLPALLLVSVLAAVIAGGLVMAVAITLTDDLAVPLAYAERTSLPAAWKKVWKVGTGDPGIFLLYVVLRFAVSMLVGVAVLAFLFPVLTGLSSGPIVAVALVVLALGWVGLTWAWNPITIALGVVGLVLLTTALFILLSVAGMPGQVYLQTFGVRFIAAHSPALDAMARASKPSLRRR